MPPLARFLRPGLALALLTSAPLARAEPGAAPEPTRPASRWEVSAGLGLVHTRVENSDMPETTEGPGTGWNVGLAFYPLAQLALVADLWWLRTEPGECYADASCYNDYAEQQTLLTAGARLRLAHGFSLQATAGEARSAKLFDRVAWSPAVIAAADWRHPLGGVELGVNLRASQLRNGDTTVSNVGLAMTVSRGW